MVEAREGLVDWNKNLAQYSTNTNVEAREGLVDWNDSIRDGISEIIGRGPRGPCGLKFIYKKFNIFSLIVEAREGLVDWNIRYRRG